MKKSFLVKLSMLALAVCSLLCIGTACGKADHTHSYTAKTTAPTCTSQGFTTHTCSCGDSYIDTYVNALGHEFTNYVSDNNATCTADGTETAECNHTGCQESDTRTEENSALGHTYDKEVAEEKYLKDEATCTSKATYYKSCVCGAIGTEYFEYGAMLTHTYDKEVAEKKYLKDEATCTNKATYYKSCACGVAGTEYFEYGEAKGHSFNAAWLYDDTYHWHASNCGHTEAVGDKAEHNYGEGNTCSCGYVNTTSYTVVWQNYDSRVLETDENVVFSTIPAYNGDTPTKEKDAQYTYTFSGWSPTISRVTADIVYIAQYSKTLNKYTVVWKNYDDTILETDTNVEYGVLPTYDSQCPTKQGDAQYGYLFDSWSPTVSNVTGDVTYTAQFSSSVNKYSVIWKNYDGAVLETDNNVAYGTVPTYNGSMPNKPYDSLNEYEFEGWSPKVEGITGDTVYTALFSISEDTTFTIKYDANGGTGAPSSQTKNKGKSITLSSTVPTNGDHVFIGWECAYDGNTYKSGNTFNVDANVTLYAVWGHYGCETCGSSGEVPYEKKCEDCSGKGYIREERTVTCEICKGKGTYKSTSGKCWNCGVLGGSVYKIVCEKGHTSIDPLSGGNFFSSQEAAYIKLCPICYSPNITNVKVDCPNCTPIYNPFDPGYDCVCIKCDETGRLKVLYIDSCNKCENGYYTAQKTCTTCNGTDIVKNLSGTYNITLKNGTSTFATKTVYVGDSFKLNIPTKTGYTFVGWFDAQENGKQYTDRNGVSLKVWDEKNNKTLYAQWIENYNIIYNLDGGSASNPTVYNIETPTFTLNNPIRTGYKFIGWSGTDIDGMSMEVIIPSISTGDREYTANWEIITYNITYNLNGGVNNEGNVGAYTIANDTITLLNPTKEHYNFVEWRLDGKKVTEIASGSYGDKTLTAIWQPKTYYISYNLNGGVCSTANKTSYHIETSTFALNNPTKTGYTFIGWTGANGSTPELNVSVELGTTGDLEFVANWSINQYTITLVFNNGNDNEEVEFDYQEDIVIDIPTWNRKSFVGWYEDEDLTIAHSYTKMPNKNYTLYAKWETYDITISFDENKKAVSVNDAINAELFGATAIDTDETVLDVKVEILAGQLQVGETITVRLTAVGLFNVKKVQTITDIRVYGIPALTCNTGKDYINMSDELVGDLFSAIGTDTFGNATDIVVSVKEGEYKAGDIVTIIVKAIDIAENEFVIEIPNVKVYGVPVIVRDTSIIDMKVSETVSNEKFVVSATDSFGVSLMVTTEIVEGEFAEGNIITVRSSATDSKGNVGYIDYEIKVYGLPTISNATTKDFKVEDIITLEALGVVAKDSFGFEVENITLALQNGTQEAGVVLTYLVVAVDHLGNENTLVIDNVRVFGVPEITCGKDKLKVEEAYGEVTVTFDLNGGSDAIASQTITKTKGLVYPTIPTRSGYAFAGWYDNSDCVGTPFDFSKNLDCDLTLYAKWVAMATTKHTREYFDIMNHTTSNNKKSVTASSYSDYNYYYFTCYTSGSYTIYEYWTKGDFYFQVDNITTGKQISKYNLYNSKTSNTVSFTANAGDVIRIGTIRYSSSYNATSNGTFYVTGAKYPTAGGLCAGSKKSLQENLSVSAKDSFGNELAVSVELASGSVAGGEIVYYTLSAVDLVGNEILVAMPVRIYDKNDIVIDFNKYASDLIKFNSCGEEFLATATDSFGESMVLRIVAVDGELTPGAVEAIKLVAIDGAENVKESEIIENIKIYGLPTIAYKYDGNYINVSDNPYALFDVKDSFGEELSFDIEVVEGEKEIGKTITYKVTATDIAGNTVEEIHTLNVIENGKVGIFLDVNGGDALDNDFILVSYNEGFVLETPTKMGCVFIGWSVDNVFYTDEKGNSIKTFDESFYYATLTANWRKIYTITYELNGGVNNSANVGEYTVESETILLLDPTKAHYDFVEWQLDGEQVTEITKGSTGNKTLVAVWTPTIYTITYELNGGVNNSANVGEYTVESETILLMDPTKAHCDFVEWQLDGEQVTEITKGSNGNKTLVAVWKQDTYSLSNSDFTAGEITNAGVYNQGSDAVISTATAYLGYDFAGWYHGDELLSLNETYIFIPDKDVVARFKMKDEMLNFNFTATVSTCSIYGIKDKTVTSIIVPDYVTLIGLGAFKECNQLIEITIPFVGGSKKTASDTYQYPFGYIFGTSSYTGGTAIPQKYYGSSTSSTAYTTYYIPTSLKAVTVTGGNILYGAFYNCSSLTSVVIPNSVTTIGNSAFQYCYSLTSVVIPDSVTLIGYSAFANCSSLTSVEIPDSVTSIGDWAFEYCYSLTSVEIPDNVTSIGNSAFRDCSSLTSVVIPDGVTSIGSSAFYECSNLTSVVIPDGVTSIGSSAFYDCYKLVEVVNKSTHITVRKGNSSNGYVGYYALAVYNSGDTFETKLSNDNGYIIYTDGTEKILVGYNGMETDLVLPSYITKINQYAFGNCSSLTSVAIGDSVTSIGKYAFEYCSSLTSVEIPDSVTSIGSSAFGNCSSLTSVAIGDSVTSIGSSAFVWCDSLTSVEIPDSVTSIGFSAFYECSNLTSVVIGNGVTSIEQYTFYGCSSLTSITIPDSVTSIGFHAFDGCDSLTEIVIPDSVTSIGGDAFYSCYSLTSVVIPDSVTSIGSSAFSNCSSLTSVYYKGTISDWSNISIDSYNGDLTSATRYYYSETKPTASGNYWHYDENGNIVVW